MHDELTQENVHRIAAQADLFRNHEQVAARLEAEAAELVDAPTSRSYPDYSNDLQEIAARLRRGYYLEGGPFLND